MLRGKKRTQVRKTTVRDDSRSLGGDLYRGRRDTVERPFVDMWLNVQGRRAKTKVVCRALSVEQRNYWEPSPTPGPLPVTTCQIAPTDQIPQPRVERRVAEETEASIGFAHPDIGRFPSTKLGNLQQSSTRLDIMGFYKTTNLEPIINGSLATTGKVHPHKPKTIIPGFIQM